VSPVGFKEESKLRLWAITRLPNPIRAPIAEAIPKSDIFFGTKAEQNRSPSDKEGGRI
jgi:hypothetical protein